MSTNHKVKFINNSSDPAKMFCKICNFILFSYDDFKYHNSYSCCNECYLTFVESQKNKWNSGWRPNKTQIKEYINIRKKKLISKNIGEI